jgi:hypothetical protein
MKPKVHIFQINSFFNSKNWYRKVVCTTTNIGIAKILTRKNQSHGEQSKQSHPLSFVQVLPHVMVVSSQPFK